MVIDSAPATNFDIVDKGGNYCGGIIAPGPNLSLQALEMAAAPIAAYRDQEAARRGRRNTISAMESGVFWAMSG